MHNIEFGASQQRAYAAGIMGLSGRDASFFGVTATARLPSSWV
jgi:hypothetical protein